MSACVNWFPTETGFPSTASVPAEGADVMVNVSWSDVVLASLACSAAVVIEALVAPSETNPVSVTSCGGMETWLTCRVIVTSFTLNAELPPFTETSAF